MAELSVLQIQKVVENLPKSLILAMFIHHKFSGVDFEALKAFSPSASHQSDWAAIVAIIDEKGGLYQFLNSVDPQANGIWNALIQRDFQNLDSEVYARMLNKFYNYTLQTTVPFNILKFSYESSLPYKTDAPNKRYKLLSTLYDIHCYLTFCERCGLTVTALDSIKEEDVKKFNENIINNVQRSDRLHVVMRLRDCDNLLEQWQHTLKMITSPYVLSTTRYTILMEASLYNDIDMVRILLNNGADINARRLEESQDTALSIALYHRHAKVAKLLVSKCPSIMLDQYLYNDERESYLLWAFRCEHRDIIAFMLQHPVDLNMRDKHGLTALMYAASFGDSENVQRLIEKGADPLAISGTSERASAYALACGHHRIAAYLKEQEVLAQARLSSPVSAPLRLSQTPAEHALPERRSAAERCVMQ